MTLQELLTEVTDASGKLPLDTPVKVFDGAQTWAIKEIMIARHRTGDSFWLEIGADFYEYRSARLGAARTEKAIREALAILTFFGNAPETERALRWVLGGCGELQGLPAHPKEPEPGSQDGPTKESLLITLRDIRHEVGGYSFEEDRRLTGERLTRIAHLIDDVFRKAPEPSQDGPTKESLLITLRDIRQEAQICDPFSHHGLQRIALLVDDVLSKAEGR